MKVTCHPTKFGGHSHCGSEDIMILVYHVILQEHVIKGRVTLWAGVHQGKMPSC